MNRDDFPMLKTDIIYFDNGATTFKPYSVIEEMNKYYTEFTANAHRGDYDLSLKVDQEYENARIKVRDFINAKKIEEVIFTSGSTNALNMIVFGFFQYYLKSGDEILLTRSEHASNLLPWFTLCDKIGCVIKYIDLDDDFKLNIDNVRKAISNNTKVISLAHITNVIGDIRPIKDIAKLVHSLGIIIVVDAAQSVPHISVDVQEMDVDFLVFSGHKMLGPTGIGVLYGKYELLNLLIPINLGGGMNSAFISDGQIEYKSLPFRLEGGTPNIAGAIGLGAAIDYIKKIGIDNIHKYEMDLRNYLVNKLSKLDNIEIYNKNGDSGIVTFNIISLFSQDTAVYLNKYDICVRAGNHCAKILKEELGIKNTCRISLYLYNTKEEIDKLIDVLSNKEIYREII